MKRTPDGKVVTADDVALAACKALVEAAPEVQDREALKRAMTLARFAVAMKT